MVIVKDLTRVFLMLDAGRFSWVCVVGERYLGLSISPSLSLSLVVFVSLARQVSLVRIRNTQRRSTPSEPVVCPCRVPWETPGVLACTVIPVHLHGPAGRLPFSNLLLPQSALLLAFSSAFCPFLSPFLRLFSRSFSSSSSPLNWTHDRSAARPHHTQLRSRPPRRKMLASYFAWCLTCISLILNDQSRPWWQIGHLFLGYIMMFILTELPDVDYYIIF